MKKLCFVSKSYYDGQKITNMIKLRESKLLIHLDFIFIAAVKRQRDATSRPEFLGIVSSG